MRSYWVTVHQCYLGSSCHRRCRCRRCRGRRGHQRHRQPGARRRCCKWNKNYENDNSKWFWRESCIYYLLQVQHWVPILVYLWQTEQQLCSLERRQRKTERSSSRAWGTRRPPCTSRRVCRRRRPKARPRLSCPPPCCGRPEMRCVWERRFQGAKFATCVRIHTSHRQTLMLTRSNGRSQ